MACQSTDPSSASGKGLDCNLRLEGAACGMPCVWAEKNGGTKVRDPAMWAVQGEARLRGSENVMKEPWEEGSEGLEGNEGSEAKETREERNGLRWLAADHRHSSSAGNIEAAVEMLWRDILTQRVAAQQTQT